MSAAAWERLYAALSRWRAAERTPCLWWRDDDAVTTTSALERLLDLSRHHSAPLALAVIPEGAEPALVDRLATEPRVAVLVHGWSHRNHAPVGEKKQELGLHRSETKVLSELGEALRLIQAMFGGKALPILVPPWNRIDAALVPKLGELGYRTLSVFGPPHPVGLPVLNTTVDIMDWHVTRGCRPAEAIVDDLVTQLDAALTDAVPRPIGLLTHHLVHDEAAWRFLSELLAATDRAGIAWHAAKTLAPEAGAAGA